MLFEGLILFRFIVELLPAGGGQVRGVRVVDHLARSDAYARPRLSPHPLQSRPRPQATNLRTRDICNHSYLLFFMFLFGSFCFEFFLAYQSKFRRFLLILPFPKR